MPSATAAGLTVDVTGTKPFSLVVEGGPGGAYRILNSAGADAKAKINGESVTSTFAKRKSTTDQLNAVLAVLNA